MPTRDGAIKTLDLDVASVIALEQSLGSVPAEACDLPAGFTPIEVTLLEVDATESSRDPCLIRSIRECGPFEHHVHRRCRARLHLRASGRDDDRRAKSLVTCKQTQDLGAGCAERAVPRCVLGEGRRRERAWLIWQPFLAPDQSRAEVGATLRSNSAPVEQISHCGDRSDRVERALVVPGADGGVGDGVCE